VLPRNSSTNPPTHAQSPAAFAVSLLPVEASLHGHALDAHLRLNLWIAVVLFVLAQLLLAGAFLRRRSQQPEASESVRLLRLEYVPLAVFTLLFAWLTLRAERLWAASRYTGADPAAMQVEVTGVQFAWYFRYPGPDATFGSISPRLVAPGEGNPLGLDPADPHGADDILSSQLVLPAGREVDLTLRAQDVIHGFFVPAMRLKQNALPGQPLHVHFTPERPGDYAILCSQLCGLGHYRMSSILRVLPPADFNRWLAARTRPSTNTPASAPAGAAQ
jgi:cytochrome c oxidase subunit 2